MPIETLPPHDPEAEAAVLGSLLIDPDAYFEVSEIVTHRGVLPSRQPLAL
jgi:replicative DNA helicase